jgi:hypothetical protein
MKQKAKINVEGGEILIRNTNGDYAVIPKKDVEKVTRLIKERCFDCIDNYVSTLPRYSDYAEDGTLIPRPGLFIPDENNTEEANIEKIDKQPLLEETQETTVEKVKPKTKEKSETEPEEVPSYIRDAINEQLKGNFSKKRKTEELTQKYVSLSEEEKRKTLEQRNELYNKISKIAKETSPSPGEIDSKISEVISKQLETQRQILTPEQRKKLSEEFEERRPVSFDNKLFSNIVVRQAYYDKLKELGYPGGFIPTLKTLTEKFPKLPREKKFFTTGNYQIAKEYMKEYFPGVNVEYPEKPEKVEIEYPSGRIYDYLRTKIDEELSYIEKNGNKKSKLRHNHIIASMMVEGGDRYFSNYYQDDKGVFLYGPFGGDTAGDKYPRLEKIGYLPPGFSYRLNYYSSMNDSKTNPTKILTGYAPDLKHAIQGLTAIHKYFEDKVEKYAKEKNISLTDEAIRFLTLYGYNAGEGGIKEALNYFYKNGLLKGDGFLNLKKEDLPVYMQGPYYSASTKLKLAQLYEAEGLSEEQEENKSSKIREIRTKKDVEEEIKNLHI